MRGFAILLVLGMASCSGSPGTEEPSGQPGGSGGTGGSDAGRDTLRVLFIGNSYTYVNDRAWHPGWLVRARRSV